MNFQRGTISISSWAILGGSVVIALLCLALKLEVTNLAAVKKEYATYKGGIEALGRQAEIAAQKQNLANMKRKERTDEESKRVATRAAVDAQRVRDDLARRRVLPEAGPVANGVDPTIICFDRAQLDAALQRFAERTAGIASRGATAEGELNLARSWALSRPPTGD